MSVSLWRSPLTYAFIAIAILRVYYVFQVPLYTTDLFRNLGYGREFWDYGTQIYSAMPEDFAPAPYQYFWSTHGYTYPATALAFFAVAGLICPGILHAKILLFTFTVLNTWMIHRMTKDRWLTFLYWANPISIWFGSYEGQFEPFVSTWVISGVWLLRSGSPWAMFCLAMGIQAKFLPVFLLPTFFLTDIKRPLKRWISEITIYVVSFLPSIVLTLTGEYIFRLFSPSYIPPVNHIPWNISSPDNFRPQPDWLIYLNAFVSKGTLIVLGILMYLRYRSLSEHPETQTSSSGMWDAVLDYLPAILFIAFLKSSPMTRWWHVMPLPAFAITIQHPTHRRVIFLCACLFGGLSIYTMLFGPVVQANPQETMQILGICFYGF